MKNRQILLKFVVWNMRWMTRYLGFVARPIISRMADREVIACGFRHPDGSMRIIFSPGKGRSDHWFVRKTARDWEQMPVSPVGNFSADIVRQVMVPSAQLREVFRVRARRASGGAVVSPRIHVKEATLFDPDLLDIQILPGAGIRFSWEKGRQANTMIHFLVVEDSQGQGLAAVYTRELSWSFPLIRRASLSIGPAEPPNLIESASYTAKLVFVDFNGWVSAMAEKKFLYRSGTVR